MKIFSITVLQLLVLSSCAITNAKVTGFASPKYKDKSFKNILVEVRGETLEQRKIVEESFTKIFTTKGIKATTSFALFPPTDTLDKQTAAKRLKENKVDAVLLISSATSTTSTYIPPTYYTNCYGGSCTTNTSGGYNISKPISAYSITLFDPTNGEKIWMGEASGSGNKWASYNDLHEKVANEILTELSNNGFVSLKTEP